jgi:hypothetical protein
MAEDEHDYKVGPGRPPLHTRFRKGQSGNPGGRRKKNLPALLAEALNEPVFVTIDGERRQITKREAVVHQLVNKSTTTDLRATKMLFDMIKDAGQKAGVAAPPPEPRRLDEADQKVVRICRADTRANPGRDGSREDRHARGGENVIGDAVALTWDGGATGGGPNDG